MPIYSMRIVGDGFAKFENAAKALGSEAKARAAYRKIINRQGAVLRKAAIAILPGQTGLVKRTIRKAIGTPSRASGKLLRYKLTTQGGYISYKYFGARETPQGVFARPRGQNIFLPKHFTKGGLFPNRHGMFGGHVFKAKTGGNGFQGWGRKITKVKSDVRIPDELVRSDMARAYNRIANDMQPMIHVEIKRLTRGAVS